MTLANKRGVPGNAAKTTVLAESGRRALADRLDAHESLCTIQQRGTVLNGTRSGEPAQPHLGERVDSRPLFLIDLLSRGALGKYRVVDGPADMKRKRQLAIFERTSGQPRHQIGHKTLLGDNFRHALIIQFVGAG